MKILRKVSPVGFGPQGWPRCVNSAQSARVPFSETPGWAHLNRQTHKPLCNGEHVCWQTWAPSPYPGVCACSQPMWVCLRLYHTVQRRLSFTQPTGYSFTQQGCSFSLLMSPPCQAAIMLTTGHARRSYATKRSNFTTDSTLTHSIITRELFGHIVGGPIQL